MANSIALNASIDVDLTPAPSKGLGRFANSLLNRVKQVGESLRHTTREDVAFLGLSMGAGFAAKASVLAALGVASGGTTILAAVAGGAAVGLAKAGVKHLRDRKNGVDSKFFSRATLMNTASSAAISAATLGFSEAFEYFSGQSVGQALGKAFHKVAGAVSEKLFDLAPGSHAYAATSDNIPRPIGTIPAASAPTPEVANTNIPKPLATIPAAPVAEVAPENVPKPIGTLHATPAAAEVTDNVPKPLGKVPVAPVAADIPDNLPKPLAAIPAEPTTPVAEVAQPKADLPSKSSIGQHPTLDNSIRERALAWARAMNPVSKTIAVPDAPVAPTAPVADVAQHSIPKPMAATPHTVPPVADKGISVSKASPSELAAQAIAKAKLALAQEELTNHYTTEHLRQLVKDTTGVDAAADATAEDLAKQVSSTNSEALLKGIQQQAPQMKVENLAASCTVEIPKEKSSVNVIKTLCYKFKEQMGGNDIAILDNSNEADPKKGLRLLYRKAVSAMRGAAPVETTNGFIAENISGPNGVVQEMAEATLGL